MQKKESFKEKSRNGKSNFLSNALAACNPQLRAIPSMNLGALTTLQAIHDPKLEINKEQERVHRSLRIYSRT